MPTRERISCGLLLHNVTDIYDSLGNASQSGYSFIVTPIVHPRYRREFLEGKAKNRPGAFTRSDLLLSTQDWSTLVVGKISSWINPDSPVHATRRNSELALEQELHYAAHLNLPAILVKPRSANCFNLARYIYTRILGSSGHQPNFSVWVYIPMRSHEEDAQTFKNVNDSDVPKVEGEPYKKNAIDTWECPSLFKKKIDKHISVNQGFEDYDDNETTKENEKNSRFENESINLTKDDIATYLREIKDPLKRNGATTISDLTLFRHVSLWDSPDMAWMKVGSYRELNKI